MHSEDDAQTANALWANILGPIYERVIESVDVYLAGTDDKLISDVTVTVREAVAVSGWVGVVEADLSPYADFQLELELPKETAACTVMFLVGPRVLGQTLIRGTGPTPGHTQARRVMGRPRVTPIPRELTADL